MQFQGVRKCNHHRGGGGGVFSSPEVDEQTTPRLSRIRIIVDTSIEDLYVGIYAANAAHGQLCFVCDVIVPLSV